MPPSACSQSASENSPPKASMTIRRASSRVSLSRSAVWTRRAVWTWVCTLPFYQDQMFCVRPVGTYCTVFGRTRVTTSHSPRTRPVQPHGLPGADLGELVDVLIGHHADHRIA